MSARNTRAFTIIDLLVTVSIIALLIAVLLPAISTAREQAKLTISLANLRQLAVAHQSYAAAWNDRQYTAVVDSIAAYGPLSNAFDKYLIANGSTGHPDDSRNHPPVSFGYGIFPPTGETGLFGYRIGYGHVANAIWTLPIVFECDSRPEQVHLGTFRLPNAMNFSQYVGGRFYDPVFYAPKDTIVNEAVGGCFESPEQYCPRASERIRRRGGSRPALSSYCLSPAAMFNPDVMAHPEPGDEVEGPGGWKDPWSLPAGFRSPSFSQCLHPSLKTHMLEHHWLQGRRVACNAGFDAASGWFECEPHYFNHAWESSPATLFYDGHVEAVGVRKAMRADGRMRAQTGVTDWGLWSRDTPWGADGYLIEYGYDQAATSFHILTTDGIRGRDVLGD